MVASIPKQVHQYYSIVPTQYRLVYLLAFLYSHQKEKVIVFVSNCELANFIAAVIKEFNWSKCGRRKEDFEKPNAKKDGEEDDEKEKEKTEPKNEQVLFKGNICKLHGDMEHEQRKKNYFTFDKACEKDEGAVLICTDVASRGLDFKHVGWVVQYDLSSQIKEYVNRIGRTARIATEGSAICFVMEQEE